MKITINMLSKMEKPCEDGARWFKDLGEDDLCDIVKKSIAQGTESMNYCNWGIMHLLSKTGRVRYSCYAARQVLKIYTDKYPDDNRVLAAIEAAEKWVDNPNAANAAHAANAANAAAYAANGAYAAHAAYAANAAANAASAAAYAAANAAAYAVDNKLRAKILRHGVRLLLA